MAKKLTVWACLLIALLVSSSLISVARCDEIEDEEDESEASFAEASSEDAPPEDSDAQDVVHVADDTENIPEEDTGGPKLVSAPGVETVYLFPNHPYKIIPAGQLTDLFVGVKNGGPSPLKVIGIRGAIVHPIDFSMVVQNLTIVELNSTEIPSGVQASFHYEFTPLKHLLPRDFGLTTLIIYEVDSAQYASVIFNGTIEITEPVGTVSGEFIFLVLLGVALVGLFLFWAYGEVQKLAKKSRKTKKSDGGSGGSSEDASRSEWLEGTAYAQKAPRNVAQVRSRKKT